VVTADVRLRAADGRTLYEDDAQHFETAVLRLMKMDEPTFAAWLREAGDEPGTELLVNLASALARLRPLPDRAALLGLEVDEGPAGARGRLWQPTIADAPDYGVAVSEDGTLGWLVRARNDRWERVLDPPAYEEEYFEGAPAAGYGGYAGQEDWRLDKARKQVRALRERFGLVEGVALDVGSSYGYFRVALEEAGFDHYGIEVSEYASSVARERYGFETQVGELSEFADSLAERFDLITLWDVVEHVAEPVELLELAAGCLRPGGLLALKTPNLLCPEAEYLGPYYHSLQRPHLVYLSPSALATLARGAGLEVEHVETVSHLLRGFVGEETTSAWAEQGRGADFTAYLAKSRHPATAEIP
jgi:2-polyprenyl-3-methyl-5-hydroxy-6-metoxy-1,4-benzoquinol methylase